MPSSVAHEAWARPAWKAVRPDADSAQPALAITQQYAAPLARRRTASVPWRSLIAMGVLFAIMIAPSGWAADPNVKTNAEEKAWLTRIATKGTTKERLDALARLADVASPESADWIGKIAFDRRSEEPVRVASIAALYRVGTDSVAAQHLVSIAQKHLWKPNAEYFLVAALGIEDPKLTAPLRDLIDKEGAKKKTVYNCCCKAAQLAGQVNEIAHRAGKEPSANSVEAIRNICRLTMYSEGPRYEKGAPTLKLAVVRALIACHQPAAVEAIFELAPTLPPEGQLESLAYLHEISGEFLHSDFEQWARWWSEKGRTSALPERRSDREDKLGGKKKVVIIWGMDVGAGLPISWEANQKAVCKAIADLPAGSDFEIWQHGRVYDGSVALKTATRIANAEGKASAVKEVMGWAKSDGVGGGHGLLPYDNIARALRDPKVTDVVYIQSARVSFVDDTDPSGVLSGKFSGRSFVELIAGANRHRDQGGKSISCINIYPGPDSQRMADLLARKNWGRSYDIGSLAELQLLAR